MDETWRYNKPKLLGDILKDIKMDPESIERKKALHTATEKNTNQIFKMLQIYANIIDTLDIDYKKAHPLINNMDEYYASEKKALMRAKKLVEKGYLTQQDINNRMQIITENLDKFEQEHIDINTSLRKTINKFTCPRDKKEQTRKANNLHELFIDIYTDIEDVVVRYSKLLSKAPRT